MISIIVPIYNAEKYLNRTINSILTQTYDNFELLLVDDGSTDKSSLICKQYVVKDERIHYYLKENGGPSSARNIGIKNSKGQFISFVDADDVVKPNFLETLLIPYQKNSGLDLIIASYKKNDNKVILPDKLVNNYQAIMDVCRKDYTMGYVVNKLFRASVIRKYQLKFDENFDFSEDLLFTINYLLKVKNVQYVSVIIYYYLFQPGSLSTKFDKSRPFRDTEGIRTAIELLESQDTLIDGSILQVYQTAYIRALTGVIINNHNQLKKNDLIWAENQLPKNKTVFLSPLLVVVKIILSKIIILFKT